MAVAIKKIRQSKEIENQKMSMLTSKYNYVLLVETQNQRSAFVQELRDNIRIDSEILFGKKKILQKTLEHTKKVGKDFIEKIQGNTFLLFTHREIEEMKEYLEKNKVQGYLKTGDISPLEIVIKSGVFHIKGVPAPSSTSEELRKCGVPADVKDGKVIIETDYKICGENDTIDARQSKLLRIIGKKLAELKLSVIDYASLI